MASHSSHPAAPHGHGPFGYGQEFGQEFINPSILHQRIPYVPIQWLDIRQNWPENAKRMLTEFMVHHDFYHYHKNQDTSIINLNTITLKLSELFDPNEWDHNTHEEKLKRKVINKIHRIRSQHVAHDAIGSFRTAVAKVAPDEFDEVLQIVFEKVGPVKMMAFLEDRD
ncbi:hypothetical protein MMC17_004380 [Xylographa soralifera]|nr:hypothetical protein [Xylographa soralifera]